MSQCKRASSGVKVPLLGGQIFGLHHPQGEDVLQSPAVVPVGVDGSPQVLHPFVPLSCRTAGETLGACGRGHLGDRERQDGLCVCVFVRLCVCVCVFVYDTSKQ